MTPSAIKRYCNPNFCVSNFTPRFYTPVVEPFDEQTYLALYPDVAVHVANGGIGSGLEHYIQWGENEGRWPSGHDRFSKIFSGLDRSAPGLEIGAGYNPLVSGANAKILDHLDQDGLIAKYASIDTSKIKPVDYVWNGERLPDLVKEKFDWVVASHVIEHVPDLIGFFNDCAALLTPGGVLTLAVPDRRYTFDYYRAPSSLAAIADAHFDGRTRPSRGAILEHFRQHSVVSAGGTWDEKNVEVPTFLPDATKDLLALDATGAYVDTHVWVFTPARFRMLMLDLRELGLISLFERTFYPTSGCEFYVQFSTTPPETAPDRTHLAKDAALGG